MWLASHSYLRPTHPWRAMTQPASYHTVIPLKGHTEVASEASPTTTRLHFDSPQPLLLFPLTPELKHLSSVVDGTHVIGTSTMDAKLGMHKSMIRLFYKSHQNIYTIHLHLSQ